MRIVRYQSGDEAPRYGWLHENKIGDIEGDLFGKYQRQEANILLTDVKLLAPAVPSKIVCVGRNYVEHAKELGNNVPKIPLLFMKPPSSIINPGDTIILPPQSKQVEHEAELVAVIGKRARNVTAEDAKNYIFGYTVGNDVTARDLQNKDGQWTRAKGFDTFCPVGPIVSDELDPAAGLTLETRVNGELRQRGSTLDFIFPIPKLLAWITAIFKAATGASNFANKATAQVARTTAVTPSAG